MAILFLIINDTYCGTIDDNTAIICYCDLIVYRGLRMTCGNVYDRDDRYIAKPLAGGSYQEIEDVFGVSITEENETSQRYFKGA